MNITTEQLKSLMGARPSVVAVKSLCDDTGVNYDNIRMRIKKGQLTEAEEEALADALEEFLFNHLGWRVEATILETTEKLTEDERRAKTIDLLNRGRSPEAWSNDS